MNAYVGLLDSFDNEMDFATEGWRLDSMREKVSGAIAKVVEFLQNVATRLASALSGITASVASGDARLKPMMKAVDGMMIQTAKVVAMAKKGKLKDKNAVDNARNELNGAKTAVDNALNSFKNIPLGKRILGKTGCTAAKAAIEGWSGKIRLLDKEMRAQWPNTNEEDSSGAAVAINGITQCLSAAKAVTDEINVAAPIKKTREPKDKGDQARRKENIANAKAAFTGAGESTMVTSAFGLARKAGEQGDLETAVEAMIAAINYATNGSYDHDDNEISNALESEMMFAQMDENLALALEGLE